MPYSAPIIPAQVSKQASIFAGNPKYRAWPLTKITFGISKKKQDMNSIAVPESKSPENINTTTTITIEKTESHTISRCEPDRDSALQQVKDILSTSPQFSTSLRRKSAPESYTKKSLLKVDLPEPILPEVSYLLRKKSGEVVRPSLKKGRSEPTTPTFPKYVHFNTDLEQIRLFNEAQKPQAVSAEASSDEDTDDDGEFNFLDYDNDHLEEEEEPELVITIPNMPPITTMHSSKYVFVKSISLSEDKRKLTGCVQVQNIAFRKRVEIRYTFDFWQTVSEVSATYAEGISDLENKNKFDLFVFSIELIDNSRNSIDGKTMYFAAHYSVNNLDFWDNNNGSNYQVNFKRFSASSSSPAYKQKANSSKSKGSGSSKRSIPLTISNQPSGKLKVESLVQSPPNPSSTSDPSTTLNRPLSDRYDIGLSLSAARSAPRAISNASRTVKQSYFRNDTFNSFFPSNCIDGMPGTTESSVSASWEGGFDSIKGSSSPIAIPLAARPAIGSSSYYDLVNQYCFYQGSYTTSSPTLAQHNTCVRL